MLKIQAKLFSEEFAYIIYPFIEKYKKTIVFFCNRICLISD